MTEAEWLACEDPARMLRWAQDSAVDTPNTKAQCRAYAAMTDRKFRLYVHASSVVCGRENAWLHDSENSYKPGGIGGSSWAEIADNWSLDRAFAKPRAALLRDIFGNPFRPVKATEWAPLGECSEADINPPSKSVTLLTGPGTVSVARPARWLTPAVLSIAQAIYDERAFDRMPVLADALEEAGCREEAILRHLRRVPECKTCETTGIGMDEYTGTVEVVGGCPRCGGECGPHVRGCWVVDLILGKE